MEEHSTNGRPRSREAIREAIRAAAGRRVTESINIPEFGGICHLRELTAAERDEYEAGVLSGRGRNLEVNIRGLKARLVAWSLVDEDGVRVFDPAKTEDIEELSAVGCKALEVAFAVVSRINGLSKDDVQELAGNSSSVPSADSLSLSL